MSGFDQGDSGNGSEPLAAAALPESVISGLRGFFNPDLLTGADASAVATLPDMSGSGRDLVQATGGLQPLLYNNVVNGRKVLRFDGTKWLRVAAAGYPATLAQPMTYFLVAQRASGTAGQMLDTVAGSQRNVVYFTTSLWSLYSGTSVIAGSAVDANWHLFVATFDGASSKLYVDGGAANAAGNPGPGGANGMTMGADAGGTTQFVGDIAFLLSWQGALTLVQKNAMAASIAARYGLTWTTAV